MSINSAMLAGVSGLVANSSALAAISDNIANVNTIGYKRNQVNFANIVTAQSIAGRYSAGGVLGLTRQFVSQQGLVQSASSPTDLAIIGDGFFVVADRGGDLSPGDPRSFTRSGSFSVDADGFLVNNSNNYLLGWQFDSAGNVSTSPSDLNSLSPINVKDLGAAVTASTAVSINANLDKTTPESAGAAAYSNAGAASMADYADTTTAGAGTKPDFTLDMSVIDSQGGSHKFVMAFLKPAAPAAANTWNAEIYAVPASDVSALSQPGQLARGVVKFNPDGSIDLANTTLFGALAAPAVLTLADSAGAAPKWDTALGIGAQTITLDLSKITQYAAASTVNSVIADGATVGNIVGVQVDQNGVVSALFDNSQIRKIAQIGIAVFPNADGLQPLSGNAYRATTKSGGFTLKQPGVGGGGQISPSSLEASTVDLSSEFTGLITTQKAYSASSKIITTADQMLDELLNIIR